MIDCGIVIAIYKSAKLLHSFMGNLYEKSQFSICNLF